MKLSKKSYLRENLLTKESGNVPVKLVTMETKVQQFAMVTR